MWRLLVYSYLQVVEWLLPIHMVVVWFAYGVRMSAVGSSYGGLMVVEWLSYCCHMVVVGLTWCFRMVLEWLSGLYGLGMVWYDVRTLLYTCPTDVDRLSHRCFMISV